MKLFNFLIKEALSKKDYRAVVCIFCKHMELRMVNAVPAIFFKESKGRYMLIVFGKEKRSFRLDLHSLNIESWEWNSSFSHDEIIIS